MFSNLTTQNFESGSAGSDAVNLDESALYYSHNSSAVIKNGQKDKNVKIIASINKVTYRQSTSSEMIMNESNNNSFMDINHEDSNRYGDNTPKISSLAIIQKKLA